MLLIAAGFWLLQYILSRLLLYVNTRSNLLNVQGPPFLRTTRGGGAVAGVEVKLFCSSLSKKVFLWRGVWYVDALTNVPIDLNSYLILYASDILAYITHPGQGRFFCCFLRTIALKYYYPPTGMFERHRVMMSSAWVTALQRRSLC